MGQDLPKHRTNQERQFVRLSKEITNLLRKNSSKFLRVLLNLKTTNKTEFPMKVLKFSDFGKCGGQKAEFAHSTTCLCEGKFQDFFGNFKNIKI